MVQFHRLADLHHLLVDLQVALVDMPALLQVVVVVLAHRRAARVTRSTRALLLVLEVARMDDVLEKELDRTCRDVKKVKLAQRIFNYNSFHWQIRLDLNTLGDVVPDGRRQHAIERQVAQRL